MRRRALARPIAVIAAIGVSCLLGCSLVVSTSGLAGVEATSTPDAEAGAPDTAAPLGEAGEPMLEGGADAARDPHLLAEYSFEDAAGQVAQDTSGNLRHARLQEDATFVADGVRGRALAVGGTGFLIVDALAGSLGFPASGTLSFWFRYSFPPSATSERSIFDDWDKTRGHLFVRRANTSTGTEFQFAAQPADPNGGGAYAFASGFDAQPNVWTHIVFTWDAVGANAALYVNGGQVSAGAYATSFDIKGQRFRMGDALVGGFDEIRLFDRPFTAAEAMKLD